MSTRYKYHTPQEYDRIIRQTEAEIDRRSEQAREAQELAALEAYVNDPRNANVVNNHPLVKSLRAMPASPGWGAPTASVAQRTAPATVAPALSGYKSRQQLERERPWLRDRKPELESVIDPYAGRKTDRIRIG